MLSPLAGNAGLRFGTIEQISVLTAIEPAVKVAMDAHVAARKLWFPNDLMPADENFSEAQELALIDIKKHAKDLPDAVRVAVGLNLLTEEGLPHFHRLISSYMSNESVWQDWNSMWTAEEDRHGCAMRDYARDARLFNMGELEKLQYDYLAMGFNPDWQQAPYRLLAYTSLQEKATQISHANVARIAGNYEPRLQSMLAHLASDEAKHYQFYRSSFAQILKTDVNGALNSLLKVVLGFVMPGHNIGVFSDAGEVIRKSAIFGPRDFLHIVEELLQYWGIAQLTGLSAVGASAQEKLMKVAQRLLRIAEFQEAKSRVQSYAFKFLYNRPITI